MTDLFVISILLFFLNILYTLCALVFPKLFFWNNSRTFSRGKIVKQGSFLILTPLFLTMFALLNMDTPTNDVFIITVVVFLIPASITLILFIISMIKENASIAAGQEFAENFKIDFLSKNRIPETASIGASIHGKLNETLLSSGDGDLYIWEDDTNLNFALISFDEEDLNSSACHSAQLSKKNIVGYTMKGNRDVLSTVSGMDSYSYSNYFFGIQDRDARYYNAITTEHTVVDDRVTVLHYLDDKKEQQIEIFSVETYDIFLELIPEKDLTTPGVNNFQSAPSAPIENSRDTAGEIDKLFKLKESGAITDSEFQELKRKLIEKK
ncbi:SHOCT domain-containing protein [Leptospira fletcheri]|uniref:SHOCT domain-containing protein n=1 Tax=Leptospira fletcheri TaxID=2484981 RepID=A0A4R9GJM4_9LEPT|nr:SHOCT domain-containing protein [Leptospira fletcheri]TGK12376.1 SHOCT domain-containing protein [Leptospira fletcheri]